jgi:hypothetical protein
MLEYERDDRAGGDKMTKVLLIYANPAKAWERAVDEALSP